MVGCKKLPPKQTRSLSGIHFRGSEILSGFLRGVRRIGRLRGFGWVGRYIRRCGRLCRAVIGVVGIGQRARRGGVVEHAVHARRDGGDRTAADADLVALEHDGAERYGVEQARAEVGIAAGIAQRLRAETG